LLPGQQPGNRGVDEIGPDGLPVQPAPKWPWYLLGAFVLALLLLSVPMVRRRMLRRRRSRQAPEGLDDPVALPAGLAEPGVMVVLEGDVERARIVAHEAWDEFMDTLVDFRVPADPAETPRSIARRLIREQELEQEAASGATRLGMAEERARYARTPLEPSKLAAALRLVRRSLAETADRRTRIMAVLMPPSVLARWRLGLLETMSAVVLRMGDLRVRLARFSPRRLLSSR
jgi:hypothetical protein